jgi:hypothetical protein
MTAICISRKSNLISNCIVYIFVKLKKKIKEDSYINTSTNKRKILNLYDNRMLIEKEKEKENNKRKLVWKTIESLLKEEIY